MKEDTEETILEYTRKVEVLETENKKLREGNANLMQKVQDGDQRYDQHAQENQMLKGEIENLRDLFKKSQEERDKLRKKVTHLSKISRVEHDDKNKEIETLNDRVAAMDRVVLKSGQDIKDLTATVLALVQEKKELKDALVGLKKEKANLEKNIQATELRLKVKSEELQDVKNQLENEQQNNSIDKHISTIDSLEKSNQKLKLEMQVQHQSNLTNEKRRKEAEEELTRLRVDLEEQAEETEKVMVDLSRCKKIIRKMKTENKILMAESAELREQIEAMTDNKVDLQIAKDEKFRLEVDGITMNSKIADLTEKLGTMEETVKSLTIMVKEKQRHSEDFLNQINRLKNENNLMKKQIGDNYNTVQKKTAVKEAGLPLDTGNQIDEQDLKSINKKIMEDNKRLRTLLVMKSMAEVNNTTQVSNLEERLQKTEDKLEKSLAKIHSLQEGIDENFNYNEKDHLSVPDTYTKIGEKVEVSASGRVPNEIEKGLPEIPMKSSLVTPRGTPDTLTVKDIAPWQPVRPGLIPQASSQVAKTGPYSAVGKKEFGFRTIRGRLNGSYSRRKRKFTDLGYTGGRGPKT